MRFTRIARFSLPIFVLLSAEFSLASVPCELKLEVTTHPK
jgi:hypothetical protein